jgi:hypothetical protein
MIIRFFFLFIALSFSIKAQTERVVMKIKSDDKISAHGFSYWSELKITSADTSFYYSLHMQNPDVIPNLKRGEYTVTLSSVFNTRLLEKVNLQKNTTSVKFTGLQNIYAKASPLTYLSDKIKLNDTLYIIFSTKGGSITYEKIGITKTPLGYVAMQYSGLTSDVFQTMQFKQGLYKYVIELEAACKKANAPKAETAPVAEVYTFELNKEINSFIIPGNSNGFNLLKAILFAIER